MEGKVHLDEHKVGNTVASACTSKYEAKEKPQWEKKSPSGNTLSYSLVIFDPRGCSGISQLSKTSIFNFGDHPVLLQQRFTSPSA